MRVLTGLACALVMAGIAAAQVDLFAAAPRIWDASLSPDGDHLATGCSPRGDREICIYDLTGASQPAVIPSPDGGHITGFYWPSPTHLIYFVESMQQRPTGAGLRLLRIRQPIAYSLRTQSSVMLMAQAGIISSLINSDDEVAVQITWQLDDNPNAGSRLGNRDDFGTVVYEMDLDDGTRNGRLEASVGSTIEYVMTPEGELVLDVRYDDESTVYSIYRARGNRSRPIFERDYPGDLPHIYGTVDGASAVAIWLPREGLRRMDVSTGEMTSFNIGTVDVSRTEPIVDEYASTVVGFSYIDDLPRQVFTDPELAGLQTELAQILTEDSVTITTWTADRSKLVVVGQDPGQPANYYLLDMTSGALGLLDTAVAIPDGTTIGDRVAVSYPASDGLTIPAYVTLPPGETLESGPFPLIVMPHGGPQSRDMADYDWWAAYYASLGYVVLHPNFRGSEGYGAEFIEAGYGGFGTRMIDDIVEGAHFLQAEGIAREGAYCTSGWSYGGYAALMAALRDSDHVACVISFAGVGNPFALMGEPGELEINRRYWEQYMGPRFGDAAAQAEITPSLRGGEFQAPMLVIHGADDLTVPVGQWRQLRDAVGDRNGSRFILLDDENHQMRNLSSRQRVLQESTDFLAEHFPPNP
tara:strand:+ start:587 stop:2506 length:1920 start_codon:yes stop_codon:yes gene_type:complete